MVFLDPLEEEGEVAFPLRKYGVYMLLSKCTFWLGKQLGVEF